MLTQISASEMIPLLIQLQVVLGVDDALLSSVHTAQVQHCITSLLELGSALNADSFVETELDPLDTAIRRFLSLCKTTFAGCSKSRFNFPKFHMPTHTCRWIEMFGPLWIYDGNRWETFHKQAAKIPYQHTSKRNKRFHDEMVSHTEYLVRLSEAEQHLRPTKRRKHAPVLDPESRACIFHGDCVKWNCVVSFDMAQQFYGSDIIASDVEHNILRNKVAAFARQRDGCAQMATRKILLYKSVTLLAATKGHVGSKTTTKTLEIETHQHSSKFLGTNNQLTQKTKGQMTAFAISIDWKSGWRF